jgi:hypothetical protein
VATDTKDVIEVERPSRYAGEWRGPEATGAGIRWQGDTLTGGLE